MIATPIEADSGFHLKMALKISLPARETGGCVAGSGVKELVREGDRLPLGSSRVKMFWFHSWTLRIAKRSSYPLQRIFCEATSNLPVLTLFTKKPCPLCDEAKALLEPYKHKFIFQEVDITLPDHLAWYERYKNDIPVFHLNGQFLMKHRVDIEKLENQLLNIEMQVGGKR